MFTKRIQKVYINISNHMPYIDPSEFTAKCLFLLSPLKKWYPKKVQCLILDSSEFSPDPYKVLMPCKRTAIKNGMPKGNFIFQARNLTNRY